MIKSNKLLIYFIIFCTAIIGLVMFIGGFVINNFKQSDPYRTAVKDAVSNPKIESETGKVIGIGYWVAGEISDSSAELTFTIEGKKRDLKVYYTLSKSDDGVWRVDELSW